MYNYAVKFRRHKLTGDAIEANAVKWAVEKKITTGTSDTAFSPGTICIRGQIVTFLNRAIAE
ncbi:MAG: S-layer homology domain-containing protein [Clostridia bacterium]|nr:S-layer homology domain-containing protein [Clostridia bacterium]